MILARCDNQTCNKDIPEGASYYELALEDPMPSISTDTTPKQFCCLGCVSEYAGRACGWTGERGATP